MRPRSRLDHGTEAGDRERWKYAIKVIGLDGVLSHQIVVKIHASNALSVEGAINDQQIALDILDNARDALGGYHTKGSLIVPGKDVTIGGLQVRQVTIEGDGPDDRAYMRACLDNAKEAIRDMHARRKLAVITEKGSIVEI